MSEKRFPEGFLWGASTAAYQVEGGIENVDWAQAAREGKVPPAGRACDHYNRFEADFDIAVSLGMNAQRFSIEWARIEPREGEFDHKEIEHYRKVFEALKQRGLKPAVNLWHFTLPLWFSERGGFFSRGASERFARYCAFVVGELGGYTDIWLTINEPEIWALHGYLKGNWPPFVRNPIAYFRVQSALARAHRAAYHAMKKVRPDINIGIAKHNIFFESNRNPLFMLTRALNDWVWNHWFFSAISGHQDFIGLNQYLHRKFGASIEEQEAMVRSDMGWEVHSSSLYHCLIALKRYGLPVYISENGIADATDSKRPAFITNAVSCVHRAIAEGVPVKGYFYWSLLDNFEWAYGFSKRFGLVEVDYATQQRRIRESAYVYKEICERNALLE